MPNSITSNAPVHLEQQNKIVPFTQELLISHISIEKTVLRTKNNVLTNLTDQTLFYPQITHSGRAPRRHSFNIFAFVSLNFLFIFVEFLNKCSAELYLYFFLIAVLKSDYHLFFLYKTFN